MSARTLRRNTFATLTLYLSNPLPYPAPMKYTWHAEMARSRRELIASFGEARILRDLDGKIEIRGGTTADQARAHDWMKQFLTQNPLTLRRVK
jgi:hypothetical protein